MSTGTNTAARDRGDRSFRHALHSALSRTSPKYPADRGASSKRHVADRQTRELARRVIDGLPARDREVLIRLYVQEQPPEQICAELGLNETQLRIIRTRAKARFADGLKRANETAGAPVGLREAEQAHSILAHALETFGSKAKADHWLHRSNQVFRGKTPLEMIDLEPQAVEIELTRIDHGVYI